MHADSPPRRYWRDRSRHAIVLLVALVGLWRVMAATTARSGPERLEEGIYKVERVIDGQTLLLASGARVRLQGIDAPAHSPAPDPAAREATVFTQHFIDRAGGKIRVTFALEREDGDGNFLAFVWHEDEMLNEELVRAGLAHANPDHSSAGLMRRRLTAAQEAARRAARGPWKEEGAGPTTTPQR